MYIIASILIIIASAALIFLVIIQKSKGKGIATNLTGGQAIEQQMGMRKATDFVEKATWYVLGGMVVLTFIANMFAGGDSQPQQQGSGLRTLDAIHKNQASGGGLSAPAGGQPQQAPQGQQQRPQPAQPGGGQPNRQQGQPASPQNGQGGNK